MRNVAEERFVDCIIGPMAVVRSCKLCGFLVTRKLRGGVGRGNGFREGNKQRGVLIQHVKAEHPAELAAAKLARSAS